jgi:uncharacterized membrane protein YbhN (UPF0104 family)
MEKKIKFIKFTLLFFIFLIVSYLIFDELTLPFNEIKSYAEELNLAYLIIAIFFSSVSLLSNSFSLLLVYKPFIKIDFYLWSRYLFNSYILDHIPFIGPVYRARKLKRKKFLSYNKFLSLHVFALSINFFLLLISTRFFLLNDDFNFFNIDLKILNLIIVFYVIFLLFIYNLIKFKSLLFNTSNNSIFQKLLDTFFNFLIIQQTLLKNKLLILKYTILITITHLFNLITFFAIFKTFNFTLDLYIQILIYLVFNISTLIKILPKNYVISEYVGASLIGKTIIGFAGGLLFFISYRFLNLFCILLLFFYFNINNLIIKKKFI